LTTSGAVKPVEHSAARKLVVYGAIEGGCRRDDLRIIPKWADTELRDLDVLEQARAMKNSGRKDHGPHLVCDPTPRLGSMTDPHPVAPRCPWPRGF